MREIFLKFFEDKPANEFTEISLYSLNHIFYIVAIFFIVAMIAVKYFNKEDSKKEKVLNIVAILILVSYISDFFFHPFFNGGTMNENGNIILDKFPFHVCTVLCPLIIICRYSKHKKAIQTPISVLASVVPFMWIVFPGSALDTDKSAFSYEIMQLFVYHGLVFAYGFLSIVLKESKLEIRKCYKEAILVVCVSLWATLGNSLYSSSNEHYNWFFLEYPVFNFIPDAINPFVVIIFVYTGCMAVYGIYYLVIYLWKYSKKVNFKHA